MATPSFTHWEELRKETRKLESEIDLKLVSYSKFGVTYAQNSLLRDDGTGSDLQPLVAPNEHVYDSMAVEIEQLLLKLSELNEQLSRCLSTMDISTSASLVHVLQHHRGKLHDYTQDFRKTKANIKSTREHAELLSSIRRDISMYKNNTNNGRIDSLLRERGSLHSAERTADSIIEQALEAREALNTQRGMFQGTLYKLGTIAGNFAGVNTIINTIRRRKTRDCLVLTFLIASCICFLIWYWLSSRRT